MVDKSPDRSATRIMKMDAFWSGRRIETEHLSKKMRPKNRKGNLPDYAVYRIAQVCSERFREVIEAHDPGVHQFEPVQIIWKDGTVDERP